MDEPFQRKGDLRRKILYQLGRPSRGPFPRNTNKEVNTSTADEEYPQTAKQGHFMQGSSNTKNYCGLGAQIPSNYHSFL